MLSETSYAGHGGFFPRYSKVPVGQHRQIAAFQLKTIPVTKILKRFHQNIGVWNKSVEIFVPPDPAFLASSISASIRAEQKEEVVMPS